jgi:hypothetical protein
MDADRNNKLANFDRINLKNTTGQRHQARLPGVKFLFYAHNS